jgi:hypothetical protein
VVKRLPEQVLPDFPALHSQLQQHQALEREPNQVDRLSERVLLLLLKSSKLTSQVAGLSAAPN